MAILARLPRPTALPWRRPRYELLILALVAVAVLPRVYEPISQDTTRICLSRAIVAGRLSADGCLANQVDRARYGGHLYTDKAPGMSVLDIVPAEIVRLPPPSRWDPLGDIRLWFVRLIASGLPFLVCVLCVGRICEGIAPGFGAAAMVAFALGTEMNTLGIAGFDHVLTATLGFLAFALAWGRRPFAAGLAAGAALTTEYEAAAILVIVGLYTLLGGRRGGLRYALGTVPGIALLGAYDWAAFGAPWHPSYRYVANVFAERQQSGLLGISVPSLHSTNAFFLGDRGLLIASPVVVAAAAGLVLVWRQGHRAEALVCAAVTAVFGIAECGYFEPYGGGSPGPRFFAPALPFLALGLAPAFARRRSLVAALTAASIVASTALAMSWTTVGIHYRETVWGEIARVLPQRGRAKLMRGLPRYALTWGADHLVSTALIGALSVAAFAIAVLPRFTRPSASA